MARAIIVDDERMILEVGKELLEAMGYEVLTAKNGKEAVKIYQDNKNNIDLLILDVIMPEITVWKGRPQKYWSGVVKDSSRTLSI